MLTKQKYLNEIELSKLQEILSRYEATNLRDVLLIRLALETGARASEVLAIKVSDLDSLDKTVFIKAKKMGRDRYYPLSPELFAKLSSYAESVGISHHGRIFPISYNRFGEIWREYRPCLKKLHALRHTKAIRTYEKTHDIKLVQQVMGHKSILTTQVYTEFVYSAAELRKSMGT